MSTKIADEVFLSRVGHDLRGELATMVAGVHYLLRYEPDLGPTARQMLDRVSGAGKRLQRLLDEVDDSVWIEGGPVAALTFAPRAASALVEEAAGRLAPVLAVREVTLDSAFAPDLPALAVSAELAGRALEHALDFAVHRSRRQAVRVRGEVVGGRPTIAITDEGGVPPPDRLERLLLPFVERELVPTPEPGTRRRERLGLGLAIARGILAAHGGELRVSPGAAGITIVCTFQPSGAAP